MAHCRYLVAVAHLVQLRLHINMLKRSLLIGINDYKQAPLQGCINDVELMSSILTSRDFEVTTLTDSNATKQNILNTITELVAGTGRGDSLVIHFSGHGSQVTCGKDRMALVDCILPYDFDWDHVITDKDLNTIFEKHREHVEVIIDACHSGAATRSVLFASKPTEHKPRFIQPPKELFGHMRNLFAVQVNKIELENIVGWGGCRDDQTSADAFFEGKYNGAFTYAFAHCLKPTRKETLASILEFMKANNFTQEPQMNCQEHHLDIAPFNATPSSIWQLIRGK